MVSFALIFVLLPLIGGFLLNPQNPQPTGALTVTNNQYLTVTEFYEQVKEQRETIKHKHSETEQVRHETEQVRNDIDNSLAVLSSQIEQRFAGLEKQLNSNNKCNVTRQDYDNLEQQCKLLQQNNTNLQNELDSLTRKYATM